MNNIANKISRFDKNIYCGCLIPTEILYLVEVGCTIDELNKHTVDWAKKDKMNGISKPSWFYFRIPNDRVKEKLKIIE